MRKIIIYFFVYLMVHSTFAQNRPKKLIDNSVRFVYLVSKDRKHNPAYQKGIEMAARSIQGWYKKQMNGFTFKLNNPIVEVAYSDKNADYFYSNPRKEEKRFWGYRNTFDEVQRLLGVKNFDANYIWVIYSDGPGNQGMGGSGVCIMPEDDLLGLIGKHPEQPEINRWIAGLGHEGGHAFGLPHPKDTQKDADAIMWTGIYNGKYPDICYLTEEDKSILQKSPFFFDDNGVNIAGEVRELATYKYPTGQFVRYRNLKTNQFTWVEINNKKEEYRFTEREKDDEFYYLKSVNRNLIIKIPIKSGRAFLSTDDGKKWGFFQNITQ